MEDSGAQPNLLVFRADEAVEYSHAERIEVLPGGPGAGQEHWETCRISTLVLRVVLIYLVITRTFV